MSNAAATIPKGEIRALTGVRGVAACYVLVLHASGGMDIPGLIGVVLRHGYLSVDLFFVLSGFVLGLNHGTAFASGFGWTPYIAFWKKRIARIYPLYFIASVTLFHPDHIGIVFPVSNLLLIQSWLLASSFNFNAWSISVEWFAYALFPLLAWLTLGRSRPRALSWAAMSLIALVLIAALPWHALRGDYSHGPLDLNWWRSPAPLIRGASEFSLGLLTFRVARMVGLATPRWGPPFQVALTAAIIILAAVPQSDILVVALVPPLVWSLASDSGPIAAVLASRPIHYLGVLSYSIYLLHPLFISLPSAAASLIPDAPLFVRAAVGVSAMLLPTLLAAVLAYHVIEQGGRRVMNVLFRLVPHPMFVRSQ